MFKNRWRLSLLAVLLATSLALPARAYEILLDIDLDDDPATINDLTYETSAVVKVILWPAEGGEAIGPGLFGLGGSCLECDIDPWVGVQFYGTSFDLYIGQPWVTAAGFTGTVDGMLLLGCADDPGYHTVLRFEPIGGDPVIVTEPIFMGQFNAWVHTVPDGCYQPASNLAAMPAQGEYWNYVQIGGPAVALDPVSWGQVKARYRSDLE